MDNKLPNTIPSSMFTYHSGIFSCEASDLNGYLLVSSGAQGGFRIRSEKTGNCVLFILVETVRDADNDILYWYFEGVSSGAHGLKAKIFND